MVSAEQSKLCPAAEARAGLRSASFAFAGEDHAFAPLLDGVAYEADEFP